MSEAQNSTPSIKGLESPVTHLHSPPRRWRVDLVSDSERKNCQATPQGDQDWRGKLKKRASFARLRWSRPFSVGFTCILVRISPRKEWRRPLARHSKRGSVLAGREYLGMFEEKPLQGCISSAPRRTIPSLGWASTSTPGVHFGPAYVIRASLWMTQRI